MGPVQQARESSGDFDSAEMVRVLIVDDSAVARAVLARAIGAMPGYVVAHAVGTAQAALDFLVGNRVDTILLDIEMPGVSGLVALPEILIAGAGAHILVVSSTCDEGASATVEALALGASDTLVKPAIGHLAGQFAALLRVRLERLALPRTPGQSGPPPLAALPTVLRAEPAVLAIGASTGGIHALGQMLRMLPADFDVPILITQHLPASFMPYFAAQVAVFANRRCDVAEDCTRIVPGRVLVAPGDAHVRCVAMSGGAAVRLQRGMVASGCTPSADPMFASAAEVWRERAVAVVLSGMGRDGADGAAAVAAAGGTVIAQDRATSVVWGMPGAVAAAGIAHAVLPPEAIGQVLARFAIAR